MGRGLFDLVRTLFFSIVVLMGIFACASKSDEPTVSELEKQKLAFMELQETVLTLIPDSERSTIVNNLIFRLENKFTEVFEMRTKQRALLDNLNRNYDASKEEFIELYNKIEFERDYTRQEISNIQRELISQLSKDEWEELTKFRVSSMKSVLNALQSVY